MQNVDNFCFELNSDVKQSIASVVIMNSSIVVVKLENDKNNLLKFKKKVQLSKITLTQMIGDTSQYNSSSSSSQRS